MISKFDKAWVAGVVAFICQYIVQHFWGITVDAGTQGLIVTIVIGLITAGAAYLVPNKPPS